MNPELFFLTLLVCSIAFLAWRWRMTLYVVGRPLILAAILFLNIIHPLIHGTFLDGGMLDGILPQLDAVAAHLAQQAQA
jgi:hypothetical protein